MNTAQKWEQEKYRQYWFGVGRKRLKYRENDNIQMYLTQIRKVANVLGLTTPIQVQKHSMELMQYELCIGIQKESVTAGVHKNRAPKCQGQ